MITKLRRQLMALNMLRPDLHLVNSLQMLWKVQLEIQWPSTSMLSEMCRLLS